MATLPTEYQTETLSTTPPPMTTSDHPQRDPMTVAQLIEKLSQHPPDAHVIVPGYEGGYEDVTDIEPTKIKLNVHDEWYYGPHDDAKGDGNDADETAILIC